MATADQLKVKGPLTVPLGPTGTGIASAAMAKSMLALHEPTVPFVLSGRTHQRYLCPGLSGRGAAKEVVAEFPRVLPVPSVRSLSHTSYLAASATLDHVKVTWSVVCDPLGPERTGTLMAWTAKLVGALQALAAPPELIPRTHQR